MNNGKYKATTILIGEGRLSTFIKALSTETFNPKAFIFIMPPHENTLLSKTVHQKQDSRCNNIISITKTLPQTITTNYIHEIKAKSRKLYQSSRPVQQQHDNTILPRKRKHQSRNQKFYPKTYTITYTISTTI